MINVKKLFPYMLDWFPVVFNNQISCWRKHKLGVLATSGNIKLDLLESLKVREFNHLLAKMWTQCLATTRNCPVTDEYIWWPFLTLITLWQNQDPLRHSVVTIGGKNSTSIWAFLASGSALGMKEIYFWRRRIMSTVDFRTWLEGYSELRYRYFHFHYLIKFCK